MARDCFWCGESIVGRDGSGSKGHLVLHRFMTHPRPGVWRSVRRWVRMCWSCTDMAIDDGEPVRGCTA